MIIGLITFLLIPASIAYAQLDPVEILGTHTISSRGTNYLPSNDFDVEFSKITGIFRIHGHVTTGDPYAIYLKQYDPDFKKVFFIKDGTFQKATLKEIPKTIAQGFGAINEEKTKEPVTQIILPGSKVNALVSQYDRVTKGTSYVFQVKTFDVKKYSGTNWNKFEGKLDGVNISAQILDPNGQVKEKFSGITKYGMFEGSILVKDSPWPQGTYTFIVTSEFQGDNSSKSLKFFVVEDGGTSTNHPPISNAGSDQNIVHPVLVTLVGSGSSDPDGDTITYSWVQTSGTSITLSSSTVSNPTFNTNGAGTLAFQLTVSDGRLTSTDTVTITVN